MVAVAAAAAYVAIASKSYTAKRNSSPTPFRRLTRSCSNLPVLHASGDPTTDILTAATLVTTPQVR